MTYRQMRAMATCEWLAAVMLTGAGFCLMTSPVAAQDSDRAPAASASVIVLRSDAASLGVDVDAIDAALLRDLTTIAGIDRPQVSPMAFEEIQLNAGCSDQTRACLSAIAGMAQVNGLIVRSISMVNGALQLDLVHFDVASNDDPARASAIGDPQQLVSGMASTVRRLFGIPELVLPSAASAETSTEPVAVTPSQPASATNNDSPVLTIVSIATLAVGAGVGIAGILFASSASSSFDDYKRIDVTDEDSAAAADAAFSDAESQATVANILMPMGGALLVGGAVMLVIGLSGRDDDHSASTQLAVAPTPDGGVLWLSGAL